MNELYLFLGLFGVLALVNILVYWMIIIRLVRHYYPEDATLNGFKIPINLERYNDLCKDQKKLPIGTILMVLTWALMAYTFWRATKAPF